MNISKVAAHSSRVRPHVNFTRGILLDFCVFICSGLVLWCFQLRLDWFICSVWVSFQIQHTS